MNRRPYPRHHTVKPRGRRPQAIRAIRLFPDIEDLKQFAGLLLLLSSLWVALILGA